MGVSDEAVIVQVLAGERAAFSILVERHRQRVFRKCLSLIRDYDVAEDCSQKTFALALERLSQFRSEAQFSTWLLSIAVNVCLSHLRYRASRAAAEVPIEADADGQTHVNLVDPRENPEQACFRKESRRLLYGAIKALSDPYRAVMILRDLEQRSTSETAQILGISEPAVKTRLVRARMKMKDSLAAWWTPRAAALP